MKSLKCSLIATVLSLSMAISAMANEITAPESVQTFTPTEIASLFEHDADPMQLEVLSHQEMKETEGAYVIMRPPVGFVGLHRGWEWVYIDALRSRVRAHLHRVWNYWKSRFYRGIWWPVF